MDFLGCYFLSFFLFIFFLTFYKWLKNYNITARAGWGEGTKESSHKELGGTRAAYRMGGEMGKQRLLVPALGGPPFADQSLPRFRGVVRRACLLPLPLPQLLVLLDLLLWPGSFPSLLSDP